MEQHKPITSILQTMGILPSLNNDNGMDNVFKQLKTESYNWQAEDIDIALIHGYYHVDGRNADQVFETPFENFCIAKVGKKYELFEIGACYRPLVVSFKENPEIQLWLEQKLGDSVIKN